jgi:GNAT superfamily N-acetyltransferase
MKNISIRETKNYKALVSLFIRNGLEYTEEDNEITTDILEMYGAFDRKNPDNDCPERGDVASMVGGVVLAKRQGQFICDGIAVEPEYRHMKIGERLLATILRDVKTRGGTSLFLVARAPEFFKKHGFEGASSDAPTFFECATCPQYNASCFPEVLKIEI